MTQPHDQHPQRVAVLQNIQGLLGFLRQHHPFMDMPEDQLTRLLSQCQLRFFAAGDTVLSPESGPARHFHIVRQGRIAGHREADGPPVFEIGPGECFPVSALVENRPTRIRHLASEDSFCLLLPREAFIALLEASPPLRDFADRGASTLLERVNRHVQQRAAVSLHRELDLNQPLSAWPFRPALTCPPETCLREAVRHMHAQQVSSIVIAEAQRPLQGIFTLRDLRRVVAEGELSLDAPIHLAMTRDPIRLPRRALGFDAVAIMAQHQIAHLCIVDEQGQLCGMISDTDLLAMQRVDLVQLSRDIRQAHHLDDLVASRLRVARLVERMLAQGAAAWQITRLITLLNDHTVCRVIELNRSRHPVADIPFTWLCFGSEGRQEQTLHTDQDNGILFQADGPEEAELLRQRLLPLARHVNRDLARCGFTLCPGQIMAGNPALCLSRQEWQRRYLSWMRDTSPEHLLEACIYFDLRPVWGEMDDAEQLRATVLEHAADHDIFLRNLAQQSLQWRPPLSPFREFRVQRHGDDAAATLNLKTQGFTPFVDAARLLCLAHGLPPTSTVARFAALADAGVMDRKDAGAYQEACHVIQQMRLRLHQRQQEQGRPWSNRLDPNELHVLDRRILREAFRQAQRLQGQLAARYRL